MERGIPFELKIPNETILKAMDEAKNMKAEITSF
jgi:antitoxin component of RelBE/YafQ-DinJ toxin-antitoxin module